MKKLLILLVVIILAGCASNAPTVEIPTNTPEPTEPKITVYEVNHDTGLIKTTMQIVSNWLYYA